MTDIKHTPGPQLYVGMMFNSVQMKGDQWNGWTIDRQDNDGRFYAKHHQEYSCARMDDVKPGDILEVIGRAWNTPYLLEQNEKFNAIAKAKATGAA